MSTQCCVCGKTRNLRIVAGNVYCKRHAEAVPRKQCVAEKKSSLFRFRGPVRCQGIAFHGDVLCQAHKDSGAEALEWEQCPTCNNWRLKGGKCRTRTCG